MNMENIAIAVHGGAGPDSDFLKKNQAAYHEGLKAAVMHGYKILEMGGSALDAVEQAVQSLENNPLFNAGRGSALNNIGEVEMDASIMDGSTMKAGAVSTITNIKNPVTAARLVMEKTNHVLLSGGGALQFAKDQNIELAPDSYFITDHQYEEFSEQCNHESLKDLLKKRSHGTVGAVAVDQMGNVAAATSTGGTCNCLGGRIGDSCIIGAGTYANNETCAVSGTGDGEFLITGAIAHSISEAVFYKKCTLQEACDLVIHTYNKNSEGDMGVISVNARGDFGISFNSARMSRAWISKKVPLEIKIY
jgi:beta-aspartyl-peptidase (threonine type)